MVNLSSMSDIAATSLLVTYGASKVRMYVCQIAIDLAIIARQYIIRRCIFKVFNQIGIVIMIEQGCL